jgi:ribosomal protein S19E (S16A)
MSGPNERLLVTLQAIQATDQGQSRDLDLGEAQECEDLGWVVKSDGSYRLSEEGKRLLDEMQTKPS